MVLFLNSIGLGEILIILLFVLVVFGADSIPGLARTLGKGIRQVKDATQDIQDEIIKTSTGIKREMNANKAIEDAKNAITNPVKEFTKQLEDSGKEIKENIEKETEIKPVSEASKTYTPTPKTPRVPLDQIKSPKDDEQ